MRESGEEVIDAVPRRAVEALVTAAEESTAADDGVQLMGKAGNMIVIMRQRSGIRTVIALDISAKTVLEQAMGGMLHHTDGREDGDDLALLRLLAEHGADFSCFGAAADAIEKGRLDILKLLQEVVAEVLVVSSSGPIRSWGGSGGLAWFWGAAASVQET